MDDEVHFMISYTLPTYDFHIAVIIVTQRQFCT